MSTLGFHFVRLIDGVPTLRDGRPVPPVGEWLEEVGRIKICKRGLHASVRAIDALVCLEWDNAAVCLVELDGIVETPDHAGEIVGSRRKVLGWALCDELLRFFARECALSVASQWEMPAIVREYLETGDEGKWDAARDAAWDAARRASWDAARDAARDAAWDAARRAPTYAARSASWAAARRAPTYASWDAARSAAWAATRDAQNAMLESLIVDAIGVDL
jgi:hypothetical protein